jgi:hypothetical protein
MVEFLVGFLIIAAFVCAHMLEFDLFGLMLSLSILALYAALFVGFCYVLGSIVLGVFA